MIIKVDTRESDLLRHINGLVANIPIFKQLVIKSETLPIGDIIIADENEDKMIIERKSITDLLASIKDGRYEEQSYRLNGLNHHNHNIIYLVEGDVNQANRFKSDNRVDKLTAYSAMFSLNYYKGFSVFRSFSLEESATIICNMAYKLAKEPADKKAFYPNKPVVPVATTDTQIQVPTAISVTTEPQQGGTGASVVVESGKQPDEAEQSEKDYVSVIKKVKKENITPDNIGEIMLCQIPGVSAVTALAILQQYKTLPNLIKELETNADCLHNITSTNAKGQTRKINKTSIANIVKFLVKK
jgi:ERCC4-type nuclease